MRPEPSGVVVIDKPPDISSAKVVARVKKIFKAQKAGHTGTLDPFATGVLVCCLNRATRIARFLLHGPKRYEAVLALGTTTDTQDATGAVMSVNPVVNVSDERIRSVFKAFEGAIEQAPPVYSALKHKGVPLYKLARSGNPVQKPARSVFIEALTIREIARPEIRFAVSCSAGTYIRTLCADIGKHLGCGGHLKRLRRTYCGGFAIDEALTLDRLAEQAACEGTPPGLIAMGDALRGLPVHIADDALGHKVQRGIRLTFRDIPPDQVAGLHAWLTLRNRADELIAVVEADRDNDCWRYCCVFP
jgi:tRNA pseudouridine55 synthase